jgi:hypothetical protein
MKLWAVLLTAVMAVMLLAASGRAEAHVCAGMETAKPAMTKLQLHHHQGGMTDHAQDCQICCAVHCLPPLTLGLAGISLSSPAQPAMPAPDHLTSSLDWPPPLRPPRSLKA